MKDIDTRKKVSFYDRIESIGEYGENIETEVLIGTHVAEVVPLSNAKLVANYGKSFKNPKRVILRVGIPTKVNMIAEIDDINYTIVEHNNYGGISTMLVSELGVNYGE